MIEKRPQFPQSMNHGSTHDAAGELWQRCKEQALEIERLREEVACYESMKEGFAERLASVERGRDQCRQLLLDMVKRLDYPNIARLYGGWVGAAKKAAGGDDE